MVASDRISAYDHVLEPPIPDKGAILTRLTLWWFEKLAEGYNGAHAEPVEHHVVSTDVPAAVAGRAMVVKRLDMFPVECIARGYLTGSVDVVMRHEGRYVVVDYKTNWLGTADEPLTTDHYGPMALHEAMGHSSYPLQALLYAVVLHRFLRWRLPGYDPSEHLGGVLYLYVRGMAGPGSPVTGGHPSGVFSWLPPVALVEAVSELLDGRSS